MAGLAARLSESSPLASSTEQHGCSPMVVPTNVHLGGPPPPQVNETIGSQLTSI